MRIRRIHILVLVVGGIIFTRIFRIPIQRLYEKATQVARGKKTVQDRVLEFGRGVRSRLAPDFCRLGYSYPPRQVILAVFKQEKQVEVWIGDHPNQCVLLKTYPILAASGQLGPKLKEGDQQVPEGIYRIESLNPNSMFHLALRLNYPNPFDMDQARREGRKDVGSDIMIHGGRVSIGCLAMGDEAAEDLFVLAAETGIEYVSVILSPVDFRVRELPVSSRAVPRWTTGLYAQIRERLSCLRKTKDSQ